MNTCLEMEVVEAISSEESVRSDNDSPVVEDDQQNNGNPRLADALAKAIRMGKSKKGRPVVLSKAKLYNPKQVKKKSLGFDIVPDPNREVKTEDEEEDVKPEVADVKPSNKELKRFKITKQEKLHRGRLKPSPLDREKERPLVKIATRGVVQLFNAVSQQQSAINKEINKPGLTEGKKEKILKSIDKKAFLDVLMGKSASTNEQNNNPDAAEDEVKTELENEEPSWKVLRDDFMMGAKLKDWDKIELEKIEE